MDWDEKNVMVGVPDAPYIVSDRLAHVMTEEDDSKVAGWGWMCGRNGLGLVVEALGRGETPRRQLD